MEPGRQTGRKFLIIQMITYIRSATVKWEHGVGHLNGMVGGGWGRKGSPKELAACVGS